MLEVLLEIGRSMQLTRRTLCCRLSAVRVSRALWVRMNFYELLLYHGFIYFSWLSRQSGKRHILFRPGLFSPVTVSIRSA